MSGVPEQVSIGMGLIASSKGPPLYLIPTVALERLAERFALGVERKGKLAWNATSDNQQCLTDKEALVDRLGHVIHHALKLRDKLVHGTIGDIVADDDAGAIAWGGMFALCCVDALIKEADKKKAVFFDNSPPVDLEVDQS